MKIGSTTDQGVAPPNAEAPKPAAKPAAAPAPKGKSGWAAKTGARARPRPMTAGDVAKLKNLTGKFWKLFSQTV